MHRSRISCRPMFGTTQRRRVTAGAFQIGSTQESRLARPTGVACDEGSRLVTRSRLVPGDAWGDISPQEALAMTEGVDRAGVTDRSLWSRLS